MPVPLAPNTTPADASGAFALLEIIGDDNKFKQRLKQLQDQAKDIEKMVEDSKKRDVESSKKLKDAEKQIQELAQREAALKNREDSLGKARNDTLALQERLNAKTAKFDEEMTERANKKEAGLKTWANELTEKERVLTAALRDLDVARVKHKTDTERTIQALSERENKLARQEQAVKDGLAELEEKRTALQARLSKLDAAIKSAA